MDIMEKNDFMLLSDEEKYELYFRAAENYEISKSHRPFTPLRLIKQVSLLFGGRELSKPEKDSVTKLYGWAVKHDFKWPSDQKPIDVYTLACWISRKISDNNQ